MLLKGKVMSRVIKFQFLYKGMPFSSTNSSFNWHKKVYTLDQFVSDSLCMLSDIHASCELIAKRQFTGLTDKNGMDIYESDVVAVQYNYMGNIIVKFKDGKFNVADFCLAKCEIIGNIHQHPELLK